MYTHHSLICAAFQFFEGLLETELDNRYLYKMPPDQPVTADMMCLMLSFLYQDWQIPGVVNDRIKGKSRHVKDLQVVMQIVCSVLQTNTHLQVLGHQEGYRFFRSVLRGDEGPDSPLQML